MAAAGPMQELQVEATCSICLEYYTDPVSTKCGHNFCRSCISACAGGPGAALPCPQCRERCRQGDLRVNRQLQSMVQLVKQLSLQQERLPRKGLCEKHEEKLKLFCQEDAKLICLVCRESSAHEQYKVRPAEEDAQKYKNNLEAARRKIETEFEGLRKLLKEQEETLLRRIEEMDKKIISVKQLKMGKLSAEMSSLEDLMRETEKKCELLKIIRCTLSRSEDVMSDPAPEQIKIHYKELVTLDADTAHGFLALSENDQRVSNTGTDQRPPGNPRRFTDFPCVLGREGFTSGRHYWELQLLRVGAWGWAAGVARESVCREGWVTQSPEGGVWAVGWYEGKYLSFTCPPSHLFYRQPPLKLGFYLDYARRCLSVFNADTLEELHTFTGAAFIGKVFPYVRVWPGADLRLV